MSKRCSRSDKQCRLWSDCTRNSLHQEQSDLGLHCLPTILFAQSCVLKLKYQYGVYGIEIYEIVHHESLMIVSDNKIALSDTNEN